MTGPSRRPAATLATEVIRRSREAREKLTTALKSQIAALSAFAPGEGVVGEWRAAIGSCAAMVGAVILARA